MSGHEQDLPLQSREIQMMDPELRDDLARALSSDLFTLCTGVLGYRDLTEQCHGPLCTFYDENPSRFKHVEMPRDHLKTSIGTIGRNIQKVIRNPNRRVLIINETSTNAERFLGAIKQHFETNRVLRTLYSKIIPKNPRAERKAWNDKELEFNREWIGPEPTIDTIGMTGAMTSRHYTDITCDDPISEEAVKSELVMRDAINRLKKVLTLMVDPGKDYFELTGTRWAYNDIYKFFMDNYGSKMALFIRGALEDGKPIWPERFPMEVLAQMRQDMEDYAFSCLMMNNPRDANRQNLNVSDLLFWEWADSGQTKIRLWFPDTTTQEIYLSELDITVTFDPASAEKVTSDQNAIITVGTTKTGLAVVLEAWAERCNPLVVIDYLFWLQLRYRPRVIGIEGVAYQKTFKYFLAAECIRREISMNIEEIPAPRAQKATRIRGLQPVMATRRLFLHATQLLLKLQLDEFPLGKHDDLADALAMQLQLWRGVMNIARWERYKQSEREFIRTLQQDARRRGLGIPQHKVYTPEELLGLSMSPRRLRDPRYALHPDEMPEEGWNEAPLGI